MVNNPFQYNVFDRIKGFFLQKSALSRLMLINIVVWIVVMFVNVLTWLFAKNNTSLMLDWFAVPANLATLAHRPWTVFTYMFLQEGFGHLFFNMLVLYFGGVIFLQFMSQRQLVYTYIVGGLTGALFLSLHIILSRFLRMPYMPRWHWDHPLQCFPFWCQPLR